MLHDIRLSTCHTHCERGKGCVKARTYDVSASITLASQVQGSARQAREDVDEILEKTELRQRIQRLTRSPEQILIYAQSRLPSDLHPQLRAQVRRLFFVDYHKFVPYPPESEVGNPVPNINATWYLECAL